MRRRMPAVAGHPQLSPIASRTDGRHRRTLLNSSGNTMKTLKFIVEKHPDGYIAYPLGLKGVVVGEGDTSEAALTDAKSAACFHIESFGKDAFEEDDIMEAFVAEASIAAG